MCLILLSWQKLPDQPLIIAANRDEFYSRPTLAADFWPDYPQILAGRDLEYGGSWLGVSRNGRFAAVTNLREVEAPGDRSRGDLVKNFLLSNDDTRSHLARLELEKAKYRPFNFIAFDGLELGYSNNMEPSWQLLPPGTHAIGNIPQSSRNEKTMKGERDMNAALTQGAEHQRLLSMLQDPSSSGHHEEAIHRTLSSRFVIAKDLGYGTRSSSIVSLGLDGHWDFWEQIYNTAPQQADFLQPQSLKHLATKPTA